MVYWACIPLPASKWNTLGYFKLIRYRLFRGCALSIIFIHYIKRRKWSKFEPVFSKENSQAYFIHLLSQQPFYWALINLLDNVPGIWATDMFDIQLFPQGSRYLEKQTCKGNSNGKGAVGEQRKDSLFFFFFLSQPGMWISGLEKASERKQYWTGSYSITHPKLCITASGTPWVAPIYLEISLSWRT